MMHSLLEIVNLPLLVSSMITYGVSVIILWNENRSSIFQFIGSLTWTLFALYVINLIWPPLWMMSILGLTSFFFHFEYDNIANFILNKRVFKRLYSRNCHVFSSQIVKIS